MDVQEFIRLHREEDVNLLALRLGGGGEAHYVLQQIEGWQRLRDKVPSWAQTEGLRYPVRLSLEQCSSEHTALYKASVAERAVPGRKRFVDLTGGMGVDFACIAKLFDEAVYVERDAALCQLAEHNFPLLGLPDAVIVNAPAEEAWQGMEEADLVFLDPARRDSRGRKVAALADCQPNVCTLWPRLLERSGRVMLKLSPMLDITEALRLLPGVAEVHVVGSRGECKELLLLACKDALPAGDTILYCHGEGFDFHFLRSDDAGAKVEYADAVEAYLYDPSPVVTKAGALRWVAEHFNLRKLAPQSHLYTSPTLVQGFPGRTFRVEACSGCGKRETAPLRSTRANLAVRGFPASVETLRRQWNLRDGGEVYIFATQDSHGRKLIIRTRKA